MRTAYLIAAHNQPAHLDKLVRMINVDWAHIFIHIDKKSNILDFRRIIVPGNGNITFLEDSQRVNVYWGGFSQVRATLNLLNAALSFHESFSRFCLLSGADFPIKSNNAIYEHFCTPTEFLRVDRRLTSLDNNSHCKNVKYLWFVDHSRLAGISGKIPRRRYRKFSLYHGASWWCLTRGCIEYIADFLKKNKDYVRFNKRVLSPDEIFFHSIIKNSPFASNISHDFENSTNLSAYYASNEHGCHYIDWNTKGVRLPKVLVYNDYGVLVDSQALFARKFHEKRSESLTQVLIRKLIEDS